MKLDEALARAKEVSGRLSKADDELNARIPAVEQALQSMRMGIPLSVEFEDSDTGERLLLCFRKHKKGAWRLMLDLGGETQMLTNAPRNIRALCVAALPLLIENAADQVEAMVTDRLTVITNTDAIVTAINAEAQKKP